MIIFDCKTLVEFILCRYCFGIGGAAFVLYGQVMWAEYSKLYGWRIHLHECSQSVMCNANPANHLKEDKVGHCLLFISMKKGPFFICIHCISVRIMTFIDSQRLSWWLRCLRKEEVNGVLSLPMTMPCSKQKWKIALHHLWQGLPEGGLEKRYKSSIIRLSLKVFR